MKQWSIYQEDRAASLCNKAIACVRALVVAFAILVSLLAGTGLGATLPAGFSEQTITGPTGGNWNEAVGIHFEDNGRMYVWERGGRVWIKEHGSVTWTKLIDISEEVGSWVDMGLLGFALDPNFRTNGYIYLMYVVDRHHLMNFGTPNYNPAVNDTFSATIGRITRYTARSSDGFTSVDLSTRHVLLGETKSSGIPILYTSHGVGSLVFGADGTLMVSCGEAANFWEVDTGNNSQTYYDQALIDGIITPKENVGAYRSQLIDSLSGKLLRLDPATGNGVPSNPYYDASNPRAAKSRVWATGLRNPYRMCLKPNTGSHNPNDGNPGTLYIGEVGWTVFEETNVCTGPGQNFGWPLFEGIEIMPDYYSANVQNLDALNPVFPASGSPRYFYFRDLIKQNTSVAANAPPFNNPYDPAQKIPASIPQYLHALPTLDWNHGSPITRAWRFGASGVAEPFEITSPGSPVSGVMFKGNASVGGIWYDGEDFPSTYRDTYFHADYGTGVIMNTVYDGNNNPVEVREFVTNGGPIVALASSPVDGGLYYVAWTTTVRKISFAANGNLPPKAIVSSNKIFGPGPLAVQFTGNASTDPEGLPLTYLWSFGDGTPNSTAANPNHTFNAPAGVPTPYNVTLTVTDSAGQTSSTSILISVNNTPPAVTITSPLDNGTFPNAPAQTINLTASVVDGQSPDNQLSYEWQTFLHHNNHTHSDPIDTNHSTTTIISPVGFEGTDVYFYRIVLKVTDPAGLSTEVESRLYPNLTNQKPNGAFTSSIAGTGNPLSIAFNASSSQDPDGDALTFHWNFGDGTTATGPTPTHTYAATGDYHVVLTVTDTAGNVDTVISDVVAGTKIALENMLPGNPASEWDLTTLGGSSTIQGFATDISVNVGGTIRFKVNTNATNYRIDIYRLGYYQGNGARKITTVLPSVALPQSQPPPLTDATVGLLDCGNWSESASWAVPADAVSGLYIGKLVRPDTGAASHIYFVVRDDAGQSDILFQTSDTTWQAYNAFGGRNLYDFFGSSQPRAHKVSYNRPFTTRGNIQWHSLFTAEYPMIRWLEANGYDISYTTGVDTARRGELLLQHKAFFSVGHDEYWAGEQRAQVEAARNAGVHLAFFSGNEVFWKTRWETSIDGSGTPYRTLVCYKETAANSKIDPSSEWTGTWRDPRFSPPSDGGRPENGLTGTIFVVNGISLNSIEVPAAFGAHRFWRNTSVQTLPAGDTAVFGAGTLGFEWDQSPDNGFRPGGLQHLSEAIVDGVPVLQDYGTTYATGEAKHNLSLYRHSSGALVFGAGSALYSWGLDSVHDNAQFGPPNADVRLQQATVNLFADMGIQPVSLQPGLVPATQSSDTVRPVSSISSPVAGSSLSSGTPVTIAGSASDTNGIVAGVEVSTDGGTTWRAATGRTSWSYTWTPTQSGPVTIKSRAVDDTGNLEIPSAGIGVTIPNEILTIWASSSVPEIVDSGADSTGAVELGVKFRSDVSGTIIGIRFYKAAANNGTHVGNLWSSSGALLASATFINETASGWQQVNFSSPVSIAANTTYVASYRCPNAHFSVNRYQFDGAGVNNPPLRALASGVSGSNGVFKYGTPSSFPDQSYASSNYWVDVAFRPGPAPTLTSISVSPTNPTISTGATQGFTATGTYSNGSTQDLTAQVAWTSSNLSVATINSGGVATGAAAGSSTIGASLSNVSGSTLLTVQATPLQLTTTSLTGGFVNTAYSATLNASGGTMPYTWSISSGALPAGLTLNSGTGSIAGTPTTAGLFNFTALVTDSANPAQSISRPLSINITAAAPITGWPANAVPSEVDAGAHPAVELGVKFRSDVSGTITGIRFYKSAGNTGPHIGNLWSSTGTRLANATFTNESASGWQQVNFSPPVAITANTLYIASYHCPNGHFSVTRNYFSATGQDNAPLHFLRSGVSGTNGVYVLGSTSAFPNTSYQDSNYWVDVVFLSGPPATLTSISVTPANPTVLTGATQAFTATGTYSNGSTQDITNQVTWTSSNPARATINASGVSTGLSAGTTTITATLSSISGNTLLTVQAAPLVLTTNSLASGLVNSAYSASLAATGGALPYTWAITSGSLPPGLTLNTGTGAITGTPTTAGNANFTARVSDSGSQSVSKALNISVSAAAPRTIWPANAVPEIVDFGPDNDGSMELGVRFRSDVAGTITGIRFYKAAANTGTHVGNLWSGTGTLLATATFTNETTSGWQQVNFATPVSISANTVYVASYFCPNAHFSVDRNYFLGSGFDNPPLHALVNGSPNGNGVFKYGPSSQFPNQSYAACNYWVDVFFQPAATGAFMATAVPSAADLQNGGIAGFGDGNDGSDAEGETQSASLQITTDNLPSGIVDVPYSIPLSATGEGLPVKWALVQSALPKGLSLDADNGQISGTPTETGSFEINVSATSLKDGSDSVAKSFAMKVKRVSPNPILIVTNGRRGSHALYERMLNAEGLNAYELGNTGAFSQDGLAPYEVVILGPTALTSKQVSSLGAWVDAGGNLLAMRPDKKLGNLLGLQKTGASVPAEYLLLDPLFGFDLGTDRVRLKGASDRYFVGPTKTVATLYGRLNSANRGPAITLNNVGSKGGQAAAFASDLSRLGNAKGIAKKFLAAKIETPSKEFDVLARQIESVETNPQSLLLVNLVTLMDSDKNLLPRFWYLPCTNEEPSPKWQADREASRIGYVDWEGSSQSFWIETQGGITGLMTMLPVPSGLRVDGVTRFGETVPSVVKVFKGAQYVFFPALTGDYEVQFSEATP
jgi:PKD repeat protein